MILCHFDGAINPNPNGKMGWGATIRDGEMTIKECGFLPPKHGNTCNAAEYIALKWVLKTLIEKGLNKEPVIIKGDSDLVVKQMNGRWKISSGKPYSPHAIECRQLLNNFTAITIMWIPREKNSEADALSKRLM